MKVLENIHLKIFAVIFAFTLWFYVQGRDIVETAMKFNIIFSGIPNHLYIEETSTSEVTAWVRAPKYLVTNALKAEGKIEFNLKNYKQGKLSFGVGPENLNLPGNFEITRIQPEKISVNLAPFMHKEVKVFADYQGRRAYNLEPQTVWLRGAKRVVENIKQVNTEKFDDSGGKKEINIHIIDPGENIYLSQDKVKVKFK